jgi:hypothetical protein
MDTKTKNFLASRGINEQILSPYFKNLTPLKSSVNSGGSCENFKRQLYLAVKLGVFISS